MQAGIIEVPSDIVVVGAAIRITPERAADDVPRFWQRFVQERIVELVPRVDDAVYAVYCDYESDHRGPYTMVLGAASDPRGTVPAGLRRVRIPRGRAGRFVVEGDPTSAVGQAWSHVHGRWEERRNRRFIADYERYAPDAFADGRVRAEIVVGLD